MVSLAVLTEPTKISISFYPLLLKILNVLKFPPPAYQFLDESRNNVYLTIRAETDHIAYVYLGGDAVCVADSCEKASERAVKDIIRKFGVSVEDITSFRKLKLARCSSLYHLKRQELERVEKGLPKIILGDPCLANGSVCKVVSVEYMPILRQIFTKVEIKSTPIETAETFPGLFVAWLTLPPSDKVVQTEYIISDECLDIVAAKESLAKRVISFLIPLYKLEIIDVNYDVPDAKLGEVLCALARESYLTMKERVLGIKEPVEPSVLLVEQDCITPRAASYQTSIVDCPPIPPKKRHSMSQKMKAPAVGDCEGERTKYFSVPPELETIFKRPKKA